MSKFPLFTGVFSAFSLVGVVISQEPASEKVTPIPPVQGSDAPEPVLEAPKTPAKYVVKAGDNPWLIAKNHGIKLEDLLKANQIKDPQKLNIGDVLVLPAGVPSKGAPSPPAAPAAPAASPAVPAAAPTVATPVAGDDSGEVWELYTIKSGDNPWNIAKRLKVDHQKIISLNEGLDFTKLMIGQQIKVPKKSG